MKKLFLALFLVGHNALAQNHIFYSWDDPNKKFDLPVSVKKVDVTFRIVDDPTAACRKELAANGHAPGNHGYNSCAIWNNNKTICTVVIPKNATMHIVGHEMLHCVIGHWH
jgi:hypothetical protein